MTFIYLNDSSLPHKVWLCVLITIQSTHNIIMGPIDWTDADHITAKSMRVMLPQIIANLPAYSTTLGSGGLPSQRANNAKSISGHHHEADAEQVVSCYVIFAG